MTDLIKKEDDIQHVEVKRTTRFRNPDSPTRVDNLSDMVNQAARQQAAAAAQQSSSNPYQAYYGMGGLNDWGRMAGL